MSSSHKLKSDTLRLNYPLELGEKVQPVLLPDSQTVEAARTATVTGWGGVFSQDPESGTNTNPYAYLVTVWVVIIRRLRD